MSMDLLPSSLEGCCATLHMPASQVASRLKETAMGPDIQNPHGL